MKFVTLTPTATVSSAIETEIMFSVASARAQGMEILKIDFSANDGDGVASTVAKQLRALKKEGRIQLFVSTDAIHGSSTEAQYLVNKYPNIADILKEEEKAIIVKI